MGKIIQIYSIEPATFQTSNSYVLNRSGDKHYIMMKRLMSTPLILGVLGDLVIPNISIEIRCSYHNSEKDI